MVTAAGRGCSGDGGDGGGGGIVVSAVTVAMAVVTVAGSSVDRVAVGAMVTVVALVTRGPCDSRNRQLACLLCVRLFG